jgi:hypothetical protein
MKESHNNKKFYLLQIYYFLLHYVWGIFHLACAKDAPLWTFVNYIALIEWI